MFLDFIDIDKIRRAILYLLLLVVLYTLQNSYLSHIRPFGVTALIVPAAIITISMFEGGIWGAVFGLISGFFGDLYYSENLILFTLLFTAIGILAGLMADHVVDKSFLAFLFLDILVLFVITFCQMIQPWIGGGGFVPTGKIALLQVLWSLPFTIPIYFIGRELAARNFG
ncbi:MAG: hypothetical protein ACOX7K_04755 [Oscillospiraceae bacterium]|jgi:hypothetical protein